MPGDEQVRYELGSWTPDVLAVVAERLRAEGIDHEWSGVTLVVPPEHSPRADAVLDAVEAVYPFEVPVGSGPADTPLSASRPWYSHPLWIAGAAAFVLLIVIPVVAALVSGDDGPEEAEVAEALGADSDEISRNDERIFEDLGRYPQEWNEAAGPFVAGYIDPEVSAEAWLDAAPPQLDAMREAKDNFAALADEIEDAGLRDLVETMAANYERKFAAVLALVDAVAAGDVEGETAAAEELDAAAAEGSQLATDLLERLRPFIGEDELRRRIERAQEEQRRQLGIE